MARKYEDQTPVVAIFPFDNLSGNREMDLYCRALSGELVTEMARFRQLRVISPPAQVPIPEATGQDADPGIRHPFDYHIIGSFRSGAERCRINVQLMDSRTFQLIWAHRFESARDALMDTFDHLVLQIAAILQEHLNIRLLSLAPRKPQADWSAYESFLSGMDALTGGTPESDRQARVYFEDALNKSPDYSYACSGMSLSYFNEWSCQLWERWEVSKNGAFEWAARAIELDEYNYIAAYVLGRVFLYEGSYETSEYYLRKALHLNPNDPDYLVRIATCLVWHNYPEEAWGLYQQALELNPWKSAAYHHVGFFILLELGRHEEALALVRERPQTGWVDFEAMIAGLHFLQGDLDAMHQCWEAFMDLYRKTIADPALHTPGQAVQWLVQINPYRRSSVLEPFWEYISQGAYAGLHPHIPAERRLQSAPEGHPAIRMSGDWCEWDWEGESFRFRNSKGFQDIARLLAQPFDPIHCTELMGSTLQVKGVEVLDDAARSGYKRRLSQLQQDLEEAESLQDFPAMERLQTEYDQLVRHLSGALGLQGRSRRADDPLDKARSAVTWRIRAAISKVERQCPSLGRHLSNSIRTGMVCSYQPERPLVWQA